MEKRICAIKKDIPSERYTMNICAWYRCPENKVIGNINIYCDQVNNAKMGCHVHRILENTGMSMFLVAYVLQTTKSV